MTEPPRSVTDPWRVERRMVTAVISLLVLWRSLAFVIWGTIYFDSDSAVLGLMAKHLSELRAFPLFIYGQNYLLGVESWLAAPLFAVMGPSIAALRLPLLLLNLAVALLLLRLLERDAGLRPALAAVPTLFFVLPAPGTTTPLMEGGGANVEPFLYVLLIWMLRARPNWCGFVLGLGFLHREFTIYGFAALVAVDAARGALFSRQYGGRYLAMLRTAAEVWLVAQVLKLPASAAGPGTTFADVDAPSSNLAELANRICLDPMALLGGFWTLATDHWPTLWGTRVMRLTEFSLESGAWQGLPGATLLFAATFVLAIGGVVAWLARARRLPRDCDVCVYLILVGMFSSIGYVAARCGALALGTRRYELLSLLALVGIGALFLRLSASRRIVRGWIALALACAGVAATSHARLWAECLTGRYIGQKEQLVRYLRAHGGVQYGYADYWVAYYVTFLTDEAVILQPNEVSRIKEYERIVAAHKDQAVRIARHNCDGGRPIVPGVFFLCRP